MSYADIVNATTLSVLEIENEELKTENTELKKKLGIYREAVASMNEMNEVWVVEEEDT